MQMRDARRVAPDGCRRTRLCHCIYESRDRLGPGGQHFSTLILAPLGKDPAVRQPGALGIGRVCPFRGIDVAAQMHRLQTIHLAYTTKNGPPTYRGEPYTHLFLKVNWLRG